MLFINDVLFIYNISRINRFPALIVLFLHPLEKW